MGGKKKTLEEAYFHINNGGITFKIVEEAHTRESPIFRDKSQAEIKAELETIHPGVGNPLGIVAPKVQTGTETKYNRMWYFEVRTSHFGSGTTFRFPLGNPIMVKWTILALERVLARMTTDLGKPTDGFEYALRGEHPARVKHESGESVDKEWPFAIEYVQANGSG